MLNGFEKFFDTLDLSELLVQAAYTEYPLDQLVYALQQHLAPRVLQTKGMSSEFTQVFSSILAGCKHSASLTRAYLRTSIDDITESYPEAHTSLFVDDTCMQSTGSTKPENVNAIGPAVLRSNAKVKSLKLRLSHKAAASTSDDKSTRTIISELKAQGMKFVTSDDARDLGSHTALAS